MPSIADLTEKQQLELAKALGDLSKRREMVPNEWYVPHGGGQRQFHESDHRYRFLFPGNRFGKCVSARQLIRMWDGSFCSADGVCQWDEVVSLDRRTGRTTKGVVSATIRKPPECLVRVFFENSEFLEAAVDHRLLTTRGWMSVGDCIQRTIGGLDRLIIRGEDGRCFLRTEAGSRSDYLAGLSSCGGRPLRDQASCQDAVPFSDDALERTFRRCGWGGPEKRSGHTHRRQSFFRPSSLHAEVRRVVRFFEFSGSTPCIEIRSPAESRQESLRPSTVGDNRPRSVSSGPDDQREFSSVALVSPNGCGQTIEITGFEVLPQEPLYDFEILPHHNYIAAGVVNHNSLAMGIEADAILQGSDWLGKKRRKPPAQVLWFCPQLRQFEVIKPMLEDKCFTKPFKFDGNDWRYDWPNKSSMWVIPHDRDWKNIQGVNPDAIMGDEQPPRVLWNELQARSFGDRMTRYVIAATATEGISWMEKAFYKPWLDWHVREGLDIEGAIRAQHHPQYWVWPRGGIQDNPSIADSEKQRFMELEWVGGAKERAVRTGGGFSLWQGDGIFDETGLDRLRQRAAEMNRELGMGRNGTFAIKEKSGAC